MGGDDVSRSLEKLLEKRGKKREVLEEGNEENLKDFQLLILNLWATKSLD